MLTLNQASAIDLFQLRGRLTAPWTVVYTSGKNATAREDGWTTLSALGSQINRSHPSFDPRNYGVAKLGELIRQQAAYLEVKEVKSGEGDSVQTHLHVRRKVVGVKA